MARVSEAGPERGAPNVLVVCPPPFDGHRLGPSFADLCTELDCALLDLDGVASYSDVDLEHLDADAHALVAGAVEEQVRLLLP